MNYKELNSTGFEVGSMVFYFRLIHLRELPEGNGFEPGISWNGYGFCKGVTLECYHYFLWVSCGRPIARVLDALVMRFVHVHILNYSLTCGKEAGSPKDDL